MILVIINFFLNHLCFGFFFKGFIYLFLERGEGKEKKRERNINVWLHLVHPLLGTWPATQAWALDWNRTGDLWFTDPRSIHWATPARIINFLKIFYLFIFREKEREKNINSCQICNPGMCHDQESNQRLFSLQNAAQPTEPQQSRQSSLTFIDFSRLISQALQGEYIRIFGATVLVKVEHWKQPKYPTGDRLNYSGTYIIVWCSYCKWQYRSYLWITKLDNYL